MSASYLPKRKVMGGAIAGAITVIFVWTVGQFSAIKIPPEVAGALTVLISAVMAYMVPDD